METIIDLFARATRHLLKQSTVAFLLVLLLGNHLSADKSVTDQEVCSKGKVDVVIERTVATASTWENFRDNPGSLRFESKRLLDIAEKKLPSAVAPQQDCLKNCASKIKPKIIFNSVPKKFLTKYGDRSKCEQMLLQTQSQPLMYRVNNFENLAKFSEWFSDFSQGSGKEGKDLYQKCAGDCSPQYRCLLDRSDNEFTVEAEVICGHARDKSNNEYELSVGFSWACDPSPDLVRN